MQMHIYIRGTNAKSWKGQKTKRVMNCQENNIRTNHTFNIIANTVPTVSGHKGASIKKKNNLSNKKNLQKNCRHKFVSTSYSSVLQTKLLSKIEQK